ncbi:response regulator transcription factor [Myxosarcina sp. GI1(2024)]
MKILVVEDDEQLSDILVKALKAQRYVVETATDGVMGSEMLECSPYDLVVLDVRLSKLDGIQLCRQLRNHGNQTPVLMLTACDTSEDKVLGLDIGADDYIVKPFDFPELMARVRALLRRGSSAPPILQWEHLQLDPASCDVSYRGQPVKLTPKEFGLLELFLRNPRQVFSRSAIIERLWTFEDIPNEDAVKTLLKRLRQKLVRLGAPADTLETVYGLGYRLKALSES